MNTSRTAAARGFLSDPDVTGKRVTDPSGSNLIDPETGKSRGGRHVGSKNVVSNEARAFALEIVRSEEYRASLMSRVRTGTLPPNIEAMLWAYAYGKPMDRLQVEHVVPGAALHEMSLAELGERAALIGKVLLEVGDAEAAVLADQMAEKARDIRALHAIDAEVVAASAEPTPAAAKSVA